MAREQPVVARDFLGIGLNMGDMADGDAVMGKQNFSHGGADGSASINASPRLNNMAMAGMKNSSWSIAATMQHFLPLRGSLDERFKEQIAENLPDRPFLHFVPPLQMQDLASNNQKNGLYAQVWRQGDSVVNSSGQVREEYGSSIPIAGGFRGSAARTVVSPSKPEGMAASGPPAASETRLPSSGTADMQHDTSLTIFYAGSVKVFNNISAEQAQAIMRIASGGNVQGNPVEPIAAAVAIKSVNGTAATSSPQDKSLMNLHSNQAVVNQQQANANQVNQLTTTNMQLDIKQLNIPAPSSPGPPGQPVVPTALPHARKASLARFLEKRRERTHSKCPYSMRHKDSSLPEERFSSTNDPTHCSARVDKKKGLIPSWMQRVSECSTSDVVVKEQNIIVT